jgi:predicted RNA polymerase sigma factor
MADQTADQAEVEDLLRRLAPQVLGAVRAHLLEMAGEPAAAREDYLAAASRTGNLAQQRYLHARAARLAAAVGEPNPGREST